MTARTGVKCKSEVDAKGGPIKEEDVGVTPSYNEWLRRHLTKRERALCRSGSHYLALLDGRLLSEKPGDWGPERTGPPCS